MEARVLCTRSESMDYSIGFPKSFVETSHHIPSPRRKPGSNIKGLERRLVPDLRRQDVSPFFFVQLSLRVASRP